MCKSRVYTMEIKLILLKLSYRFKVLIVIPKVTTKKIVNTEEKRRGNQNGA